MEIELMNREKWVTIVELRRGIIASIDSFHNRTPPPLVASYAGTNEGQKPIDPEPQPTKARPKTGVRSIGAKYGVTLLATSGLLCIVPGSPEVDFSFRCTGERVNDTNCPWRDQPSLDFCPFEEGFAREI
jgi:hypothetical protein